MKNIKFLIYSSLFFVSQTLLAGPYSVTFSNPISLMGKGRIEVERVLTEYSDDNNRWEVDKIDPQHHECNFRINILGRDVALENQNIGEHYFGNMWFTCKEQEFLPFTSSDFQTKFSRVLILGLRDCVQSETTVDHDYCTLTVVALRKDTDLDSTRKDLLYEDKNEKDFYRINSKIAEKIVRENQLLPLGMPETNIDSFQVFRLHMGKEGNDFYIHSPTKSSNFSKGRNHHLRMVQPGGGDKVLVKKIDTVLSELYEELNKIELSQSPSDTYKEKIVTILQKFSFAIKQHLEIISPVNFFSMEKKLGEFETHLIDLAKSYNELITDRSSLVNSCSSDLSTLRLLLPYLNNRGKKGPVSIDLDKYDNNQKQVTQLERKKEDVKTVVFDCSPHNEILDKISDSDLRMQYMRNVMDEYGEKMTVKDFTIVLTNANLINVDNNLIIEAYYLLRKKELNKIQVNALISFLKNVPCYDSYNHKLADDDKNNSYSHANTRRRIIKSDNNINTTSNIPDTGRNSKSWYEYLLPWNWFD